MMSPNKQRIRRWNTAGRTLIQRLFLDRQIELWLSQLDPVRTLDGVRAEIIDIIDETEDAKTFVLRPNGGWLGHRAGQYTSLEVEIDGVRVRRCYSIASAPGSTTIAITVKRVVEGQVSGWLHTRARRGHIVGLGPAQGEFVLPDPAPSKLLLLSGGSGITPVMSMLRHLANQDDVGDIVFMHHARSRHDVIFGEELEQLALCHSGLRLIVCLDDDDDAPRGFDEERLARLVPDFDTRSTYLCGPGALMERAEQLWARAGVSHLMSCERFVAAPRLTSLANAGEKITVELARSQREVSVDGAGTLLEQLERAGQRPASGCRMGICRTCTCRKQSGSVENLLTGEVSNLPDEEIQLCISVPRSDLSLDL